MNQKTLCFVAGRSGGHIIPALTLCEKSNVTTIVFFSANSPIDKKLTANNKLITHNYHLALDNVPLRKPWKLPLFGIQFLHVFFKSLFVLKKKKPEKVISTGGYISIPVCLAARALSIPFELFEFNAIPGKATKFLAPFAKKINICFEQAKQHLPNNKTFYTPYPIRYKNTEPPNKHDAKKQLNLSPDKKTILVLGGSQGSIALNNMIKKSIMNTKNASKTIQFIHQTGALDTTNWNQFYKQHNITALTAPFFENLEPCYHAADLVICRSGAGSLFETLFFKKNCVTVPLETKQNNHQAFNALAIKEAYPDLFTVAKQEAILYFE